MKKWILMGLMIGGRVILGFSCAVCERNQPKPLRGIVHGAGPESDWDYLSVGITAVIALVTLYYSIKWLIHPNEKDKNHIKYSILQ
jgi:phage shock protein PspC (stress-responsive transcriptional regulator)